MYAKIELLPKAVSHKIVVELEQPLKTTTTAGDHSSYCQNSLLPFAAKTNSFEFHIATFRWGYMVQILLVPRHTHTHILTHSPLAHTNPSAIVIL